MGTKQDYGTPRAFISAVEARFGAIVHDLAAEAHNTKHPSYYSPEQDSLSIPWAQFHPRGNLWLNPPFKHIAPWAKKCAIESKLRDDLIIMLTPASIGAQWYFDHAYSNALTIPLLGRIPFDGAAVNPKTGKIDGFTKDCMLTVFGRGLVGFQPPWDWRKHVVGEPAREVAS